MRSEDGGGLAAVPKGGCVRASGKDGPQIVRTGARRIGEAEIETLLAARCRVGKDGRAVVRPERSAERAVEGRLAPASEERPSTTLGTNGFAAAASRRIEVSLWGRLCGGVRFQTTAILTV